MNLPFTATVQQQVRNHLSDQADITESQRESVKDIEQRVDALVTDYSEAEAHIKNDARLSPEGKEADLSKLKQDYIARLRHITDGEVKQIEKRLAEMEVQLRPQRPDTDPVVHELQLQEIRSLLRGKPEIEIIGDYQTWATEGTDDIAMMAVEGAPQFAPLISDPSILEAGRQARAARHNPKSAALLRQLRQMQGLLKNIIASAEAAIDLPADDMLSRIAAGKTEAAA